MSEKPKYALASNHLDATEELLDRAFAHLVAASRAGADTFEIQLAVDGALGLLRVERQTLEQKQEETNESESTI